MPSLAQATSYVAALISFALCLTGELHLASAQTEDSLGAQVDPNAMSFASPSTSNVSTAQTPAGQFDEMYSPADDPFSERNFKDDVLVMPIGNLLGDWFGLRTRLIDDGITPSVTFVTDMLGNPVGGLNQGFAEANNVGVNALFDLEKRRGIEGASFLATISQRSGRSLSNEYIGNVFSAQQVFGDPTFHAVDFVYIQKLSDNNVECRLGRLAAADDFLVSSYTYGYVQGGINGTPAGIFQNAPGMTGYPNATWGATVKLNTTARTYVMGGIYNGDTSIRALNNHGMDFSLDGPPFGIVEVGYRRNQLASDHGLVGNYKFGAWYDGNEFPDLTTQALANAIPALGLTVPVSDGNYGFCALFDQILIPFGSEEEEIYRGMGVVGSVVVAPDQSKSKMPYYFATGIAARGIWVQRPRDTAAFAFIFGEFSSDTRDGQRQAQQIDPNVGLQDHEIAMEWTYIFRFRNGAYFLQPDLQYILKPGGTGQIPDAFVCGMQVGANF